MNMDDVTALRLQVLANGYMPIKNHDKRTFLEGWPSLVVTEELIRSWDRQRRDRATGLRVQDGLMVVDLDVSDKAAMTAIANAIFDAVPGLDDPAKPLLVRHGKGFKEAWFLRCDELFGRVHGRGWVKPGETPDDGVHRVEIFGGGSPRQFGAFGPHTIDEQGNTLVEYSWADDSPLTTPLAELPMLTKARVYAIADAVDRTLEALGWQPMLRSQAGEQEAIRVYDLTEDMHFDIDSGERLSLPELRARALALGGDGGSIRCSASWLEGSSAVNRSRCIVGTTRSGHVSIYETAAAVTHVEVAGKPREYEIDLDRLAEKLTEIEARRRNKVTVGDGAALTATKLLASYAYCPYQKECVVPMWASSIEEGMTMQAFRTLWMPNCDEEVGPRGGRVAVNPVDIWAGHAQRVSVAGLRMRPDMPRPVYEEDGRKWVNTYSPPTLVGGEGGDPVPGIDFIDRLIPDPAEREWATQAIAHKYRYPHIPGPAIVMVAHGVYGTGRGTLAALLKRLLGSLYVREMPYSMIAGRTYQSQYTDWAANQLVVFVAESSEVGDGSTWKAKHDTYEHLKGIIDPSPAERTFIAKGRSAFTAMACATYIICTNHADALPIPPHDRRFGVVANGRPQSSAYWAELREWMAEDANVAAFGEWLRTVNLEGYNPYEAPRTTEAKEQMVDASRSDLDQAYDIVLANLPGDVLVLDQLVAGVRQAANVYSLDLPDRWQLVVKRMALARLRRVGVRDSTNWQVKWEQKKFAVYAKTPEAARHWKTHDGLREEVLKNGSPAATGLPGNVLVGLFREGRSGEGPERSEGV